MFPCLHTLLSDTPQLEQVLPFPCEFDEGIVVLMTEDEIVGLYAKEWDGDGTVVGGEGVGFGNDEGCIEEASKRLILDEHTYIRTIYGRFAKNHL